MYIHKLNNQDLIWPSVSLSSLDPSTENDWSAWEKDDQEILAYEDIVWLGIRGEGWWEKEYAISVISESIRLEERLSDQNLLQNHRKVWEGPLKLKNGILVLELLDCLDVNINVTSNLIRVEIFVDYSPDVPSVIFKVEEHK